MYNLSKVRVIANVVSSSINFAKYDDVKFVI